MVDQMWHDFVEIWRNICLGEIPLIKATHTRNNGTVKSKSGWIKGLI